MNNNVAKAKVTRILVNYCLRIFPTHEMSLEWYEGWNWREAIIRFLSLAWSGIGYEHGGTIRLQFFTGDVDAHDYEQVYVARIDSPATNSRYYTLFPTKGLLAKGIPDVRNLGRANVNDSASKFAEIDVALMSFVKNNRIENLLITCGNNDLTMMLSKGTERADLYIAIDRSKNLKTN